MVIDFEIHGMKSVGRGMPPEPRCICQIRYGNDTF